MTVSFAHTLTHYVILHIVRRKKGELEWKGSLRGRRVTNWATTYDKFSAVFLSCFHIYTTYKYTYHTYIYTKVFFG